MLPCKPKRVDVLYSVRNQTPQAVVIAASSVDIGDDLIRRKTCNPVDIPIDFLEHNWDMAARVHC